MKLVIDIPAETYKAISEWDEPKTKYAAEYMLYQFVKNGKRIEQTNCTDAISRSEAIRIASGYCHWTNIPDELAKLPSVNPQVSNEDIHREREQAYMCGYEDASKRYRSEPCEDVISRKQALDAFGLSENTRKYGGDHSGYNTMMLYEIQDVIEGLPSVITEKTGRWIDDKCSVCGKGIEDLISSPEWYRNEEPYFCPFCGAKLEVEESESCKGCQNICVMYDPNMKGCKDKMEGVE